MELAREGLYLLVLLVAPPVGAALVAGLSISILQTATQIQEQTIGFAVRMGAVIAAILVAAPWMGAQLIVFTETAFGLIRAVGAG
ncbi:MAG: type III secretion HrpO family protein [Bradymonadia bacterium]